MPIAPCVLSAVIRLGVSLINSLQILKPELIRNLHIRTIGHRDSWATAIESHYPLTIPT